MVATVRFLAYLLAGLCSCDLLMVYSSEFDDKPSDFSTFTKDASYSETTELTATETQKGDPQESYSGEFSKSEPLVSDPVFEETSRNKSSGRRIRKKRDVFKGGWTYAEKMKILQLHNIYRGNVTPPAGNMMYMEWDEELENLSQKWADGCILQTGMPDNSYPDTIGQNLYIGTDPTGSLGLYLWFKEYHDYDLRKQHCAPHKQCKHYLQMAWSESSKLGCAMAKCNMRYYVVCHYSPQALKDVQMYRVAKPCTQCSPGTKCLKNLCITQEQCSNNPFDCQDAECKMECQNCGRLDKESCTCECTDGWDSPDCSHLCVNKHKRCGMSPGWPTQSHCSLNGYAVAKTYCRKMCEMCQPLHEASNNTCCNRKMCDDGFVLDTTSKPCRCIPLCPGPLCDGNDTSKTKAFKESRAAAEKIIPQLNEWDEELEKLAQKWADQCAFEHGMPDNSYPDTIGQNLYIGTDRTGYLGLYLWYEEYHHYDLRKQHCAPYRQCGHYVQMAWSESSKLGCAVAKCNMRYYVVCHYSPQALRGVQMFRVAKPCTQCSPGTKCLKNLCITQEQCSNNPFECQDAECKMECQNCGRLDKESCSCECRDGWDSPDCSHLCVNKHKRCGMSPGWPTQSSCALNGYDVAKTYCRKMCEMCQPLHEASNNTCCNRKMCDDGFVLNTRSKPCRCVLLCPGPLCDGKDTSKTQAFKKSRAGAIKIIPQLIVMINIFILWKTFLCKII